MPVKRARKTAKRAPAKKAAKRTTAKRAVKKAPAKKAVKRTAVKKRAPAKKAPAKKAAKRTVKKRVSRRPRPSGLRPRRRPSGPSRSAPSSGLRPRRRRSGPSRSAPSSGLRPRRRRSGPSRSAPSSGLRPRRLRPRRRRSGPSRSASRQRAGDAEVCRHPADRLSDACGRHNGAATERYPTTRGPPGPLVARLRDVSELGEQAERFAGAQSTPVGRERPAASCHGSPEGRLARRPTPSLARRSPSLTGTGSGGPAGRPP